MSAAIFVLYAGSVVAGIWAYDSERISERTMYAIIVGGFGVTLGALL